MADSIGSAVVEKGKHIRTIIIEKTAKIEGNAEECSIFFPLDSQKEFGVG